MNNQLLQALSLFMDQTDSAYQSDQYQHLNKAFEHLNKLYEELADQTDVEELVQEVILDQKTKRLMNILDEVEEHKSTIKNIKEKTMIDVRMKTVITNQREIIELLEYYILIDSNLA